MVRNVDLVFKELCGAGEQAICMSEQGNDDKQKGIVVNEGDGQKNSVEQGRVVKKRE